MRALPIVCFVAFASLNPVFAQSADPVPRAMLGTWALDGKCDDTDKRLVISDHTATFGTERPDEIVYHGNDGPNGQGALHWKQEGITSNLEYDRQQDAVVFNQLGWGYPAAGLYRRCDGKTNLPS